MKLLSHMTMTGTFSSVDRTAEIRLLRSWDRPMMMRRGQQQAAQQQPAQPAGAHQ
jgi:hypothetical protein